MGWVKEIREGWRQLDPGPGDLRRLGLTFLLASALAAGWLAWTGSAAWPWLMGLAALWGLWGWLWPRGLKPVYLAWMGLALVLGALVSRVLLTVVFFLVLAPTGMVLRLMGKDLLDMRPQERASYWRARPPGAYDPRQTEKMY